MTGAAPDLLRTPVPDRVTQGWQYRWGVGIAAISALAFGTAAVWSAATPVPYPLDGLARIASKPWYAWPLFALSIWALLLLLVKGLRTPFNLIFAAGVMAGVGFTVMFFVGGGGIALLLLSGYLIHVARGASTAEASN